jgi:hypothetical protein
VEFYNEQILVLCVFVQPVTHVDKHIFEVVFFWIVIQCSNVVGY